MVITSWIVAPNPITAELHMVNIGILHDKST